MPSDLPPTAPALPSPTAGRNSKRTSSIVRQLLTQYLLLTTFAVIAVSLLSIIVLRYFLINKAIDQLSTIVSSKEYLISQTLRAERESATYAAREFETRRSFDAQGARRGLEQIMREFHEQQVAVHISTFFDASGRAIATSASASGAKISDDDQPLMLPATPPSGTMLIPSVGSFSEWRNTDVFTAIRSMTGSLLGTLAIRFDSSPLFAELAQSGRDDNMNNLWVFRKNGTKLELFYDSQDFVSTPDDLSAPEPDGAFIQRVFGKSGVYSGNDESGYSIAAAYQVIPSTEWEIVGEMSYDAILAGVGKFTVTLLILDFFLILLVTTFSYRLSKDLTSPLVRLAKTMRELRPGNWTFTRSVFTGNEVEVLDEVGADLASRLRTTYEHLEEEVSARTAELKKQSILDRTILENIAYGVFVMDTKDVVTQVNPAACQLLMLTAEEIVGKSVSDLFRFYAKGKPLEGEHPIAAALKNNEQHTQFLQLLQSDRGLLPVSLSVRPLCQGNICTGSVAILQDLREQKRMDEMKSEFISIASHQLRTPLASVRWYLELLQTDDGAHYTEDQLSFLKQIDHSAKRMADLLDELMRISHLEEGEIRTEWKEFDIVEMMQQVSEEFEPLAAKKGLQSEFVLPKEPLNIKSDPVLLHIVLQNLFTNAAKYSKEKTTIHFALERKGDDIAVSVRDEGIGIPLAEQPHIFQKFFRAKNAKEIVVDGNGLGLFLSKMIMENLGGDLSFVSVPDHGTTFTILLPTDGEAKKGATKPAA